MLEDWIQPDLSGHSLHKRTHIGLIDCLFALISCSRNDSSGAPVAVIDNVLDVESLTFSLGIIEDDPLEITIEKSSKKYIATLETVSEVTGAYDLKGLDIGRLSHVECDHAGLPLWHLDHSDH